jgi:hypothetical protein
MELFNSYLNRHIEGSEHMLRGRMKKSYDKVLVQCRNAAGPTYTKWLANKIYTYYPGNAWVDEPTGTAWALRNIADFEFLVQMIAASHFISFFGKWISISKNTDIANKKDNITDFEFE